MALTSDELNVLESLKAEHSKFATHDEKMLRYYRGQQRVEQLGMAIPPEMRRFLVVANWPRVVVDTILNRQQVRALILPGDETADPRLSAIWDASNLSAHTAMFNADRMIYGRAFMSVGANAEFPELPLVRVESPREMVALVDTRTEKVSSAARFYSVTPPGEAGPSHADDQRAVLYLPDVTIYCSFESGAWTEDERHNHDLGTVPVVMHLNRRTSGGWWGESQMTDIIPLADSAARSLTNLQFAQEAHGIPRMWMAGVKREDFFEADGVTPRPQFEAYFDAIHMLTDPQGRVGQLTASDLKNFETAVNLYGKQAATVSGFPARYFGIETTNPPAEGAIRADEATLIRSVEAQNEQVGMTLGWVAALALRFATGEWVQGNRVRVEWFDPATPTIAQRMDATVKAVQSGILPREGAWDELGYSEARKAQLRAYFDTEQFDPFVGLDPVTRATIKGAASGDAEPVTGA